VDANMVVLNKGYGDKTDYVIRKQSHYIMNYIYSYSTVIHRKVFGVLFLRSGIYVLASLQVGWPVMGVCCTLSSISVSYYSKKRQPGSQESPVAMRRCLRCHYNVGQAVGLVAAVGQSDDGAA
jgi:hypothetical protein